MTRFFFHFRQGNQLCLDDQGIEFADFEAAYDSAFQGAVEMWTELLRERIDPRLCAFEVKDESGLLMFKLPFGDVLESCRRETVHGGGRRGVRAFLSIVEARDLHRQSYMEFKKELLVSAEALRESRRLIAEVDKLARLSKHVAGLLSELPPERVAEPVPETPATPVPHPRILPRRMLQ